MRKKNQSYWYWLLGGAILIAVGLYFVYSNQHVQTTKLPMSHYKLQKTGAGVIADFTDTSQQIHQAVDQITANNNFPVRKGDEQKKEQTRTKVEGKIVWDFRSESIALPPDVSVNSFTILLEQALKKVGGEILVSQPELYQGKPVMRIDVGCRDNLDDGPIAVVIDRLYVFSESKPGSGNLPLISGKGKLAIIIDDFGYNSEPINAFANIDRPLTFSVLPNRPYSLQAASRGVSSGHQVILHLPMEPLDSKQQSEAQTVTVNMADSDVGALVSQDIRAIPGLIGVNNHQGSRATSDKRIMKDVLTTLQSNQLFFVDSRTSGQSIAYDMARQLGVHSAVNDLFIDNQPDVEYIKGQLRRAIQIAVKQGQAVVIGHARLNTAEAVHQMIGEIESSGVKLVFVSELVQ
jgi:polysaccharide deacetylase 2 family uncharacterized protein YibQ